MTIGEKIAAAVQAGLDAHPVTPKVNGGDNGGGNDNTGGRNTGGGITTRGPVNTKAFDDMANALNTSLSTISS